MMNRKEFYEYVKDNVKEYLPESYRDAEIKLQEVEKNNGLKLTGITIPNGNQRIVPTVYLDSLYQEYINGKDVDSCVGDVADMRIEAQGKAEFFDMGVPDIFDYEKMKDKLQVRICDREWNEERLADKVVTEHGDFDAYYAVNLKENENGIGSIPVTISLMNEWGVSAKQIQTDAMAADQNRGVVLMDMNEMVKSMIFGGEPENLLHEKLDIEAIENPMFCLTNTQKMNGASLLLQEDIRKQIGECPGSIAFERLNGDYGFGYDPLFIPADCGVGKRDKRPNTEHRSYAQLTPDEKDAISHRGNALAVLEKQLPEFLGAAKEEGIIAQVSGTVEIELK